MVSRAAYHVITFLLVMTASVGSFHVPTARRPRVHLAAKSPMERFDEVLDYFEGKAGYTGFTEAQLDEASNAASEKESALVTKKLSATFDNGPKTDADSPEGLSEAIIAFMAVLPITVMLSFRFINPDQIEALTIGSLHAN